MQLGRGCLRVLAVLSVVVYSPLQPVHADLSGFIGSVRFDEDANLNPGMGFGLRWGRSSGLIGGETSVMIVRPERDLKEIKESATAIFYEARLLANIPAGVVSPFVGVGFGQIIVTATDVPTSVPAEKIEAFKAVSKLQISNALSYGGGIRYSLNERVDLRADLRQYLVFSVAGLAAEQLQKQAGLEPEESTVRYNELSAGVNFRF